LSEFIKKLNEWTHVQQSKKMGYSMDQIEEKRVKELLKKK